MSDGALDDAVQPLVSCIMPTYNRRTFVPRAISYFLSQDYVHKELVIIDDGTDEIRDLVSDDDRIHYVRLAERQSIGYKRNLACEQARGHIIVHWDDDDWHASYQLSYQVSALLRESADACGIARILYYDIRTKSAWQYIYPPDRRPWLYGSAICYTRTLWEHNPFENISIAEVTHFLWSSYPKRLAILSDETFYIGIIHDHNTSPKLVNLPFWHLYSTAEIQRLMGNDWYFYHNS